MIHLKLPATSANLGPGFDALGLAMSLYLTVDGEAAPAFQIKATGRNPTLCADVDRSLILTTYRDLLGPAAPPLALTLHNEIPLGMGCGSSAAALLAGVLLANHFGQLGWTPQQVLEEACRREGHPDNVAACFHGGMTASSSTGGQIQVATCGLHLKWRLLLALPESSLATEKARALLPSTYTRADAVINVQSTAMLVAAFALNRPDLLRTAMAGDRIHQPYRMEVCPLLPLLLPLAARPDVLGVALSGAGPSILVVATEVADTSILAASIRELTDVYRPEVLVTSISCGYFQSNHSFLYSRLDDTLTL